MGSNVFATRILYELEQILSLIFFPENTSFYQTP